jgi:hypothetical protein
MMNATGRPTEVRTDVDQSVAVVDTFELRWFVRGPLPAEVRNWFTGSTGVVEVRRDSYLVDDRVDVGIKRRGETTLELKLRQRVESWVDLGDALAGPLEWWRKWTPAEDLVEIPTSGRWIDVDKSIIKRRFSPNGTEVAFTTDPGVDPACDVEVASVSAGGIDAWTLAFAAFGPPPGRRENILAAWRTLRASADTFRVSIAVASATGYPERIARCFAPDTSASVRDDHDDGERR